MLGMLGMLGLLGMLEKRGSNRQVEACDGMGIDSVTV